MKFEYTTFMLDPAKYKLRTRNGKEAIFKGVTKPSIYNDYKGGFKVDIWNDTFERYFTFPLRKTGSAGSISGSLTEHKDGIDVVQMIEI